MPQDSWRRCPTCVQGGLFDGLPKVRATCAVRDVNNAPYPSDDFPPYLTIFVVGHLVVPPMPLIDPRHQWSIQLEAAIWMPVTVLLRLLLLPTTKGVIAARSGRPDATPRISAVSLLAAVTSTVDITMSKRRSLSAVAGDETTVIDRTSPGARGVPIASDDYRYQYNTTRRFRKQVRTVG